MLLKYRPEDGPEQEFIFKARQVMSVESEPLEECGGTIWTTYDEFVLRLSEGNLKARRALLWIMLRRQNPRLRFSDLVVRVDELELGYDDDELADMRARIEADETLSEEERAQALALAFGDASGDEPPTDDRPDLPEPEEVAPGKDEPGDSATDSP